MRLLLDTSVLKALCHPVDKTHRPAKDWFASVLDLRREHDRIYLPEMADYELRREYLYHLVKRTPGYTPANYFDRSVELLDQLVEQLDYLPLTTQAMRRAALLHAVARAGNFATAGVQALDCDAIIAAQALEVGAAVVTENARHFTRHGVVVVGLNDPLPGNSSQPIQ